jgi:hypothetical protein
LLGGALAAELWVISLVVLEGAGNPAAPSGGEEIAGGLPGDRTAILIAATLHVLGGFFFLWFVAALRSVLDASGAASWLTTAMLVGGAARAALMLGIRRPVDWCDDRCRTSYGGHRHRFLAARARLLRRGRGCTCGLPRSALDLGAASVRVAALARLVRCHDNGSVADPADRVDCTAVPAAVMAHRNERDLLAPLGASGPGWRPRAHSLNTRPSKHASSPSWHDEGLTADDYVEALNGGLVMASAGDTAVVAAFAAASKIK